MSVSAQQYCLRWNNHRSNLLTVFDELLQNEAFTDVTLACDGGAPIKCHRMVLAACSPYFQNLFIDLPCKHPVVVLKDVKHSEIKAILEYMYRGEVNVAQDQLAALLKVAETLKVKGLVEENRSRPGSAKHEEHLHQLQESPPLITTTAGAVHSSSNPSPPSASYKNHYYAKSPTALDRSPRMNLPMWAVPGLPLPHHTSPVPTQNHPHPAATAAAAMLSCYEASGSDMSPLKRKKLSSLLMNRDTPILRTVLGQGQADSSQPVSLVCHPDSHESLHSNGSDDRMEKHMKNEPSEDAQSPYTDFSSVIDDEEKPKMAVPSSSPQSYANDMRSSGIATYVPTQKPEWKRYKQYSRQEIMAAIEAVRNGMSALQAARKYGVPSRTLYDKVKKLGITTSRPFKRGSNGSTTYGSGSPFGSHLFESDEASMNNNSALMEASTFLQHAMDRSGDERDSLAAMVAAATLHQARNNASPPGHARSPSPNSSLMSSGERDDDEVEDLSMGRKPQQRDQQPVESGHTVIMGPTTQLIKKEEVMN